MKNLKQDRLLVFKWCNLYIMKNSLILILFLSILLSQHHNHGHDHMHGEISGLLLNDATGSPVEYATISIFKSEQNSLMIENSPVTGGISNEDGYFNIENVWSDIIRISALTPTAFIEELIKSSNPIIKKEQTFFIFTQHYFQIKKVVVGMLIFLIHK